MTRGLVVLPGGRISAVQVLGRGELHVATDMGIFRWCPFSHQWRWEEDSLAVLQLELPSPAVMDELRRLREIRTVCPALLGYLEQVIAAQGDAVDRELMQLQHALAELLHPSAPTLTRSTPQP